MSINYIDQITDTAGTTQDISESDSTRIFRATCSTGVTIAAKVATLNTSNKNFSLTEGVRVAVTFTYGNSATIPTLRVDGATTGIAYPIYFPTGTNSSAMGNGTTYNTWGADETVIFTYDGDGGWVHSGSALGIYNAYTLANSKGTVTSVGVSNATNGGLSVSGSPITGSGSITVGHSNVLTNAQTTQAVYPIAIDKNGHISSYGNAVTIPESDVYCIEYDGTDSPVNWSEVVNAVASNKNIFLKINYGGATYSFYAPLSEINIAHQSSSLADDNDMMVFDNIKDSFGYPYRKFTLLWFGETGWVYQSSPTNAFLTCNSAANSGVKNAVTYDEATDGISSRYYTDGFIVSIKFTNGNTYTSGQMTLRIQEGINAPIVVNGTVTSSSNTLTFNAGEILNFMFSNGGWYYIGKPILETPIADPTTKTNGQYLKYNGSSWVAADVTAGVSDVQINGTSILSSGTANILTNTAYNSSSNKVATMTDINNAMTIVTFTPDGANRNLIISVQQANSIPNGNLVNY